MIECKRCGAELDFREAFCSKCGELTQRSRPFFEQLGKAAAQLESAAKEIGAEFATLGRKAWSYIRDEANRKRAIAGGAAFLVIAVVFTDNPIAKFVSDGFIGELTGPRVTAGDAPDLEGYEDVFLGEEAQYQITSIANVRDYPTSEGTKVTHTFEGGETIYAREVVPIDGTSRWFKLTSGGYIWGGNLQGIDEQSAPPGSPAGLEFPVALHGQWADRNSCADLGMDTQFAISRSQIDFGPVQYGLMNIRGAGSGLPSYQLERLPSVGSSSPDITVQEDARWPVIWVSYANEPQRNAARYFRSDLPCSEVMAIAERMF